MEYTDNKTTVLGLFLEFVAQYIPLTSGIFATLGGLGLEAKLWQKHGISEFNGWLVERGRDRSDRLIREWPYRFHSSLSTFAETLESRYGNDARLDSLHLDFCGQLQVGPTKDILPLVLKSRGRCLAITTADSRRNIFNADFNPAYTVGEMLLNNRGAARLMASLRKQCETEKGVEREFGLFITLLGLLVQHNPMVIPDRVERYIYHNSRSGFRMRTYFLHFPEGNQGALASAEQPVLAEHFSRIWVNSNLLLLDKGSITKLRRLVATKFRVNNTITAKGKLKKRSLQIMPKQSIETLNTSSKLAQAVAFMGPDVQSEYRDLVGAASAATKLIREMTMFHQRVGEVLQNFVGLSEDRPKSGKRNGNAESPAGSGSAASDNAPDAAQPSRNVGDDNTIGVQIELVKAKAATLVSGDPEILERAKAAGIKILKLSRQKNRGFRIGALLARTQDSRRPNFVKRVLESGHASEIESLAQAYSKIDGSTVTADQLRSEAGANGG